MKICPSCYFLSDDKALRCEKCATSIASQTKDQYDTLVREKRMKDYLKGNVITGIILCFGLPTLFGLPSSLLPKELMFNLLWSLVFGAPLGYLCAKYASDWKSGILVGCGIGVVYALIMSLFFGGITIMSFAWGLSIGLIPGAIMGYHIGSSR